MTNVARLLSPADLGFGPLFWAIREAVVVADVATGRIVLWNPVAEEIFGYSAAEAVGLPLEALVPDRLKARHHAGIAHYRATGRGRLLASGRPFELPAVRNDGSERTVELTLSPIEDAPVGGRFVLACVRDVTDRQAEEETAHRLATIVESSEDAILGLTLDGVITSWNPGAERLYGYIPAEVVGQSVALLFPPERSDELTGLLARVRRGEKVAHFETVRVRKDGTRVDVSLTISPLRDAAGQLNGAATIARDITERKRAEQQRLQLAREQAARAEAEAAAQLLRRLQAVSEVALAHLDPDDLLRGLLARVRELLAVDTVAVQLLEGDELVARAAVGLEEEVERGVRIPVGQGFAGRIAAERQPVLVEDVEHGNVLNPLLRGKGLKSLLGVPLLVEGRVLGVLHAGTLRPRRFGEGNTRLLHLVADHVAMALERARLFEAERQARVAAELSEQAVRRWERIFTHAGWAVAVANPDDNTLQAVNPAFAAMHGYSVEELLGKPLADLFAPESRSELPKHVQAAHEWGDYLYESIHIRKNGTCFPCLTHVTAVKDLSGKVVFRAATFQDLTASRAAERALRESEQRLRQSEAEARRLLELNRATMANLGEGIYTVDTQGRVTYMNPEAERLFGWKAEELLGRRMHEVTHYKRPDGSPFPMEECAGFRVLHEGQLLKDFEDTFIRKDGGFFPVSYSSSPLRDHAGEVVGLVVVFRDTTERKRVEEERARLYAALAERERQLQDLVGRLILAQEEERRRVAYNLHDGLAQTAAGAHLHLRSYARRYKSTMPGAREELDRALMLAQRVVREARTVVHELRPTALDDLGLEEALRTEVEELKAQGWQMELEADLGPERLEPAVETTLFRVAQEALRNARKHAGADRAQVALRRTQRGVRLEVQDWGRGFQPEAAQQGAGPGERVGLSGMKERVALLGGRCEVKSRPGSGTRIVAEVPLRSTSRPMQEGADHRA